MKTTEKKISAFCARHGLSYEWQPLRFDGIRAFVESVDRFQHAAILDAARRLKGVRVTEWTCNAGGVWEGRVYFQDATDAQRIDNLQDAESKRNENWWLTLHSCLENGMDHDAAIQHAESLYPTPA